MQGIKIRQYQKSDWSKFQDYIAEAFGKKNVLRDSGFFNWQYDGGFFIAEANGKIVGHFGYRDIDYKFSKETRTVRVLMNFLTLEKFRSLGIGALLAKEVFRTNNPILVLGFTIFSQKLFSRLDNTWQEAGNLKRMIAVFNNQAPFIKDYKSPNLAISAIKSSGFEIKEWQSFDFRYDDFWEKARDRYHITVERTAEYLSWRFARHPHFKYKILEIYKNNKLSGFLIWRTEVSQGFKIARIIDLISYAGVDEFLILEFLNQAKKSNAHAADFMFSGSDYDNTLIKSGFFNIVGTEFEKFPILFSPISYKKTIINIAYNFTHKLSSCFLTKADGDQDRPNKV